MDICFVKANANDGSYFVFCEESDHSDARLLPETDTGFFQLVLNDTPHVMIDLGTTDIEAAKERARAVIFKEL